VRLDDLLDDDQAEELHVERLTARIQETPDRRGGTVEASPIAVRMRIRSSTE
jgi:hypothetical protein